MRWLIFATIIAVFGNIIFPRADLVVSGLFFTPGQGFYLEWHPLLRGAYLAVHRFSIVYMCFLAALGLLRLWFKKGIKWRNWIYLVAVVLIGPILLIDIICKEHVGRPRPRQIVEFSGTEKYMPPLHINSADENNNGKSFVSGHAAVGFYIAAFAFISGVRFRKTLYATGIIAGSFIGFLRVMQGGHFLSDVVFSGLIMLWTIHLLALIIFGYKNKLH